MSAIAPVSQFVSISGREIAKKVAPKLSLTSNYWGSVGTGVAGGVIGAASAVPFYIGLFADAAAGSGPIGTIIGGITSVCAYFLGAIPLVNQMAAKYVFKVAEKAI